MIRLRCFVTIPGILLAWTWTLDADTLYQISPQGRRVVIQRNAIVVKEDTSAIVYKHFELKERRVEKAVLYQGSLPYQADLSAAQERQQIVKQWKRFGYTATVTDASGKVTKVFDAYLDFYPPGGRGSLLESVPALTVLPLQLDAGGADEVEFSDIDRIEAQGDHFKVTLRKGTLKEGKFLMPTTQPVEARFLGITDRYDPASPEVFDFSLPLSQAKLIVFEP
ncbi:MAG TPA: hypothetical protein VMG63_24695 [Terriglobia bacterium]|jgi:hypothetical protein|nr:hypothetical protein [Terriglobia bacterium]